MTVQPPEHAEQSATPAEKKRRRWPKVLGLVLLGLVIAAVILRLIAAELVQDYVNRTLQRNPDYVGKVGQVRLHLWRGAYAIEDVKILKKSGNNPVPLFSAERVGFMVDYEALWHGRLVGRVRFVRPEINFLDMREKQDASPSGETGSESAGGMITGGPWLGVIRDLSPFRINSAELIDGSMHFRAFQREPPVDVYLSRLNGTLENLTNIRDETTPLLSVVKVTGEAMDTGKLEYEMKFDPFSYYPTFQLAMRLTGLDVTEINTLARSYGNLDFEHGFFDLVVEFDCKEGQLTGHVKPLFRNLQVLALPKDLKADDPLQFFWETLVGATTRVLRNWNRDQFGTDIPVTGSLTDPEMGLFPAVINVLRNAFIRAYLPRLDGYTDTPEIQFAPAEVLEPPGGPGSGG